MSVSLHVADGAAAARSLVLGHELVVGDAVLRVEEAEAYLFGDGHRDPFAHRHPVQAHAGRWYFHRVGPSYRGGSFKGLDLTFGPPDTFGGVLIRTLSQGDRLVSGPSRCVDHLLALAEVGTVAELDDGRDVFDARARLRLRAAPRAVTLLRTARIGLTLKRHVPGDERPRWLLVPDRFLSDARTISKGRVHAVIALHQAGRSPASIREATGSTAVERYLERYRMGIDKPSFDRFVGRALSSGDYAELHGIWTRTYGSDTIAR